LKSLEYCAIPVQYRKKLRCGAVSGGDAKLLLHNFPQCRSQLERAFILIRPFSTDMPGKACRHLFVPTQKVFVLKFWQWLEGF